MTGEREDGAREGSVNGSQPVSDNVLPEGTMRIFTHGQKAHADDLIACAILVAVCRPGSLKAIIRCNSDRELPPIPEDDDFVVDVGGKYDGIRHFDHHQSSDDVKGECAATLVARHYCPELLGDVVWGPFLKRVALQDNHGLRAVESSKGDSRVNDLLVIEWGVVSWFEKNPLAAATFVAGIIQGRLDYLKKVEEAESWVSDNGRAFFVGGVSVFMLKRDPREDGLDPAVVNTAMGPRINDVEAKLTMSFDPRSEAGKVRTLFRTKNGEGSIDLTKASPQNPVFCHKAGFLLNFIPADEEEWKRLVRESKI